MFNLISTVMSTSQPTGSESAGMGSMLMTFAPLVLIVVVMYFLMIRPQKKKEKKETEMRNNIQIGDEVVTAGGIVGIVFSIKEDEQNKNNSTVVIETGGDRSKIRIKKWAIYAVETVHDVSVK